jgi:hypothetical protein
VEETILNTGYLTVAALAFTLGVGTSALWHRGAAPHTQTAAATEDLWCDAAHTIRFIDAEHCAGMTSCDRAALLHMARPYSPIEAVPCPKE